MISWKNAAIAAPILSLRDKQYREYLRLLFFYGRGNRYQTRSVRFLGYRVTVPDAESFIFQFKDIFVARSYHFYCDNDHPVIYDCGANIGLASLYFKVLFPHATIRAFEADPTLVPVLQKNLAENRAGDIEIIPKAVWSHSRGVPFSQEGADAGAVRPDRTSLKVPSVRLKDYLRRETRIDFLKMDIEGAETEVLLDCGSELKVVHRLFVEYHRRPGERQSLDTLLKLLSSQGFQYYLKSVSALDQPLSQQERIANAPLQLNVYAERPAIHA